MRYEGAVIGLRISGVTARPSISLGIATVVMAVGAFSWWLVLIGLAAWIFARRFVRPERERRRAPPPASM
jgi:hypothetical protein